MIRIPPHLTSVQARLGKAGASEGARVSGSVSPGSRGGPLASDSLSLQARLRMPKEHLELLK